MAERIGLRGTLALCTLGSPSNIPGREPVGASSWYNSSDIMFSFFSLSKSPSTEKTNYEHFFVA